MSFVAVAVGGSALVGAVATSKAAGKASKAQIQASQDASAVTREQIAENARQYDQDRTDLAPYREAGYTALGRIGAGTQPGGEFDRRFTMADFEADPGYQFRLSEGNKAIERSAAARGGVLSGATVKALQRYGQGLASEEYGAAYARDRGELTDRYNRLATIAGVGQTATNAGIAAGQQRTSTNTALTGQLSNNLLQAGNARASQYVATGNAVGGAVQNIGQYFAMRDLLGGMKLQTRGGI